MCQEERSKRGEGGARKREVSEEMIVPGTRSKRGDGCARKREVREEMVVPGRDK